MQGNVLGQTGSGLKINGIIEEYQVASGGKVNAGDFVTFINNYGLLGKSTQLSTGSLAGQGISAIKLSENKIFIAHSHNPSYRLYGVVCTIDGTSISMGTDTQLSTIEDSGIYTSTVILSENKVFIAHSYNSSSYYLYGIVCTIEGESITAGTDTSLSSITKSGYGISATKLSDNKILITHCYGKSDFYLYGMVCTIDGTKIIKGTDTQLSTKNYSGSNISAVTLSENKVFITYTYNKSTTITNYYLYGIVCTIEGMNITKETDTELGAGGDYKNGMSQAVLSDNKVIICYIYNYSYYGMVCTIDETSITKGTSTKLTEGFINPSSSNLDTNYSISVVTLPENKAFITYNYYTGTTSSHYHELYAIMCMIDETTITINENIKLIPETLYDGYNISPVALLGKKVFIAYGYKELWGIMYNESIGNIDTIKNLEEKIFGIAKTKGKSEEMIKIYRPKASEYISTEDGNRIITENGEEIKYE